MPKAKAPKTKSGEQDSTRIAIVAPDKCKPKKCRQECKKGCPVNRMGKATSNLYLNFYLMYFFRLFHFVYG